MSATKEMWMSELESIFDGWCADHDDDRARARLKSLGFDPDEIDEHIEALRS